MSTIFGKRSLSMSTSSVISPVERLYTLSELTDLGYGSRATLYRRIADGTVPAVRTSPYSAYKIRESDLPMLIHAVDPATVAPAYRTKRVGFC